MFVLFLGCITTFHLWFISSGRLDLAPDEAHYWTWSKRLDWSYYSKGPMVAYLIGLSTRLGGDTEFFVRLPAVLLSAGTALVIFLLARRLFQSEWAGLEATLLLAAMPLAEAGSILMTIDAPFVFFWSLTLYLLHRALATDAKQWWMLAGIGLGLGLLSKYTMAVMVAQSSVYLALSRTRRLYARRPGPYLALGMGILLFAPVVWWNATHDWVSFRHLLGQLGGGKATVTPLKGLPEFVGSQVGVATPVVFGLLMIGMWQAWGRGLASSREDTSLFLLCASAPLLLLCLIVSVWSNVQANWAAPAYIAAAVATAGWRSTPSSDGASSKRKRRYRGLFATALLTGFLVSALGYFPHVLASVGVELPSKLDPTSRLQGWRELGQRVSDIHQAMSRSGPTFLLSDRYQIASEIMFYVPTHPKTLSIPIWRRMNQFDVWGGTEQVLGWNAIYVTDLTNEPPAEVLLAFESVRREWPNDLLPLDRANSWAIFWCYGFRGFPPLKPDGY